MPVRRNKIPATRNAIRRAAALGVQRAGLMMVDLAQQLSPVDEGDLKSSIRLEPEEPALEMTVKAGGISGPNKFVDYAGFVEFGTAVSEAQPFLTPAVKAIKVRTEVRKAIKEVLK